ncbi:hypothetical protein JCM1840_002636 [Sporobolomyces johnsonii]
MDFRVFQEKFITIELMLRAITPYDVPWRRWRDSVECIQWTFWRHLVYGEKVEVLHELETIEAVIKNAQLDREHPYPEPPTQRMVPLIWAMIDTQEGEVSGYESQRQLVVDAVGHDRTLESTGAWRAWFWDLDHLLVTRWSSLDLSLRWHVVKDLSNVATDIHNEDVRNKSRARDLRPPTLDYLPGVRIVLKIKAGEDLEALLTTIVTRLIEVNSWNDKWKSWCDSVRDLATAGRPGRHPIWRTLRVDEGEKVLKELEKVKEAIEEAKRLDRAYPDPPTKTMAPEISAAILAPKHEGEILESLAHDRVRLSPRQRSNYGMRYAGNAGF